MCKIKDEMLGVENKKVDVCIGCGTTEDVTKCDNTMCKKCWTEETRDDQE